MGHWSILTTSPQIKETYLTCELHVETYFIISTEVKKSILLNSIESFWNCISQGSSENGTRLPHEVERLLSLAKRDCRNQRIQCPQLHWSFHTSHYNFQDPVPSSMASHFTVDTLKAGAVVALIFSQWQDEILSLIYQQSWLFGYGTGSPSGQPEDYRSLVQFELGSQNPWFHPFLFPHCQVILPATSISLSSSVWQNVQKYIYNYSAICIL